MATIPSSGKDRDWVGCLRRTMANAWFGHDVSGIEQPPAVLNGEYLLGVNAAGTGYVPMIGMDGDNVVVAGNTAVPGFKTVTLMSNRVGIATARQFWIADSAYTVVGVQEIHAVAETTAPIYVANVNKTNLATGTSAPLNSTLINLRGAANTLQNVALSPTASVLQVQPGDRLIFNTNVAGNELSGLLVEVIMAPGNRNNQVSAYYSGALVTDNCFFIANHPMTITRIDYMHAAAASSTCNVQVTLDTGTTAPGAGTDILPGLGFDCTAAANIIQSGTLGAVTRMNTGDRLSLDFSGTTTGLSGALVTVTFAASADRKEVNYHAQINSTHGDAAFFIADRPYQVEFASAVWSTAAVAGANCQLVIDSATGAPGAGIDLLSMDTNAGFQIDGTANTVEAATFISAGRNFLQTGDRLSLDFTATTTIVGMVCTVTLRNA